MTDMLTRQRLSNNLLDQLQEAQRQIAELQRQVVTHNGDGFVALPGGLLLRVLDDTPPPPPPGQILLYAQLVSTTVYLRAMDSAATVKTLDSWV